MKKTFFLALLLVLTGIGYAQAQRTITGRVTDASTGEAVPFSSIIVQGTTVGTRTDNAGNYSLTVPANATVLVFSSIGYSSHSEIIGNRSVINASLEPTVHEIEEVTVAGYGTARRIATVVASVAQISTQRLINRPTTNVIDGMQGQVAGVQAYTSTGEPGQTRLSYDNSTFRLHGSGSLGADATPLIVMDGVPVESLSSFNTNDFESVTFLKDASATSIYGSRASNGVVFITTKRGVIGEDARITASGMYGVSRLADKTFWDSMMTSDQLAKYWVEIGEETQENIDLIRRMFPGNTNWGRYLFVNNTPTWKADLSIQGGGGKTTYFVSGSYFNQEGVVRRSAVERYTVRSNIESKANDWLKFGMNLSGTNELVQVAERLAQGGVADTQGGLIFLKLPWYDPFDENGNEQILIPGAGMYGLTYQAQKKPANQNTNSYNGMAFLEITPIDGLTIRSQGGVDGYEFRYTNKRLASYLPTFNNGYVEEGFERGRKFIITNTAEYKFRVRDDHAATVLLGQEGIDYLDRNFYAYSDGHTDDRLMELQHGPNNRSVGKIPAFRRPSEAYAFLSFFGRLEYGFQDKYFADFSIRNDQSSRFGINNRSAMFYSGGVMWNAMREDFLKNVSWLSSLKVRFSIGSTGNSNIGNFTSLGTVGTNTYNGQTGWHLSSPGNVALTWEKQVKATLGISAEFYSRYRIGLELYNRSTNSMLMDVPYPFTSGFDVVKSNVGVLKNRGIDITIGVDFLRTMDAWGTFTANFNYNASKVTELFLGFKQWTIQNAFTTYVVGKPVEYYMPLYAGVDPDNGFNSWYLPGDDISKPTRDKNRTTQDFKEEELTQSTGKPRYAPMAGGFSLAGGWKGISLQADFTYTINKWMINNDRFFAENPWVFQGNNQSARVLDYWKQPGDIAAFPQDGVMEFDDNILENSSFLRLKTITLSYNLPENIVART